MEDIINRYSPLALAFVGDAHYNLVVKQKAAERYSRSKAMQDYSIRYCSAKGQAVIIHYLVDNGLLSEKELEVYRRGRNAKGHEAPKNTDIVTYKVSTGFESLWGYWYLSGQETRLEQVWSLIETLEV